jgi:chromosome segregation ATPase
LIEKEIKEVNIYKKELTKNKKGGRWLIKMWNFLWGKNEENQNPEVLKKLEVIENHLQSYSNKFNEVSESLKEKDERDKMTESYLEKMSNLHAELKKIEEYYEEELDALKTKLNKYKQKEVELQKEVSLLNKNLTEKQVPLTSERENELEKELETLRKQLQSQSNKKNNMYQQMKNQASKENKKSQTEQMSNPEYEKYGSVPMPNESKKTMFDPRRYNRS